MLRTICCNLRAYVGQDVYTYTIFLDVAFEFLFIYLTCSFTIFLKNIQTPTTCDYYIEIEMCVDERIFEITTTYLLLLT